MTYSILTRQPPLHVGPMDLMRRSDPERRGEPRLFIAAQDVAWLRQYRARIELIHGERLVVERGTYLDITDGLRVFDDAEAAAQRMCLEHQITPASTLVCQVRLAALWEPRQPVNAPVVQDVALTYLPFPAETYWADPELAARWNATSPEARRELVGQLRPLRAREALPDAIVWSSHREPEHNAARRAGLIRELRDAEAEAFPDGR